MKKKYMPVLVSLILAILYGLVFFSSNTPLGPAISSDNAIYLTMGTAIAEGRAPYLDVFDHKGPLVFILQALPQLLFGGYSILAVFCQEIVFLFVCLLLIAKLAEEFSAPYVPAQLVYLALGSTLLGGGNLTEEYAAAFTLGGLLIIVRTFKSGLPEKTKGLFPRAALLGAMTALAFLTRANNALVLLAMTIVLAVSFAVKLRFKALSCCACGFVLGFVAACLPVCLWLAAHNALYESFYGAILHNMMYAETGSTSRIHMLLHHGYGRMAMVIAAVSCMGALMLIKKSPVLAISMIMGAASAGAGAFISQKFYNHYLYIGVPLAAMGTVVFSGYFARIGGRLEKGILLAIVFCCLAWLIPRGMDRNASRLAQRADYLSIELNAKELYALVPYDERDSFMAYRVEPMWYVAAEALPSMRFYFLQEILADADPAVMDEIVDTFSTDPPKWLVIYYNREFGPPYDARVNEIFKTRYEFVAASGTYQLLRLREAL